MALVPEEIVGRVSIRPLYKSEQCALLAGDTVRLMESKSPASDVTVDRLLALNIRLTQCLLEAGVVRMRLLTAREANRWPDFRFVPFGRRKSDLCQN